MNTPRLTILVVGATGSIGRLVVEEAARKGHAVRALARDPRKAHRLLPDVEVVSDSAAAGGGFSRGITETASFWHPPVTGRLP